MTSTATEALTTAELPSQNQKPVVNLAGACAEPVPRPPQPMSIAVAQAAMRALYILKLIVANCARFAPTFEALKVLELLACARQPGLLLLS
jgi:hypothetical protein